MSDAKGSAKGSAKRPVKRSGGTPPASAAKPRAARAPDLTSSWLFPPIFAAICSW